MPETFVLITGACHGGWSWRPVAEQLRAAGHQVLTPTLPGLADGDDPRRHSLDDVADYIVALVERHDLADVTMVAHSWGGYPMTGAAHRLAPRLRKLVYWSAFVPAEGVPLMGEVPPHYAEMFTQVAAASGNNSVLFPYEVFTAAFMQDAEEGLQRLVHGLLTRSRCSTSPRPSSRSTRRRSACRPATWSAPRTSRCRPASTAGRRASPSAWATCRSSRRPAATRPSSPGRPSWPPRSSRLDRRPKRSRLA
ncbi:alpha/beta fold hydrolase [Actinoplanes subtropicus]|uniref:alpha/beta fold hydrolase n=1 Tax=Actinoplanes subtropicus TaxID=543632 RepID=UPI000AECB510|nr:alpha/beta fold hydrolase [Actinoplanes subtropicus]